MTKSLKVKMEEATKKPTTDKTKPSIKESDQNPEPSKTSVGTDGSFENIEMPLECNIVRVMMQEIEGRNGIAEAMHLLPLHMRLELVKAMHAKVRVVLDEANE